MRRRGEGQLIQSEASEKGQIVFHSRVSLIKRANAQKMLGIVNWSLRVC